MKYNASNTIILFFSLFLSLSIGIYLPNDDIAIVRQRVLELMIWPTAQDVPSVTNNALHFASILNSSCYWPDINYKDKSIIIWDTATHMHRITTMLQALTVNGSLVQNNTNLRTAIHCALNIWLINDWQDPNWWFNQIDIPIHATSQLLMLGSNVTSFEIKKIEEISYRAAWWLHRPQDTGANLLDMIRSQLYRSLATDNITGINQGFSRIWEDIAILPLGGQGMQSDWSYHFHGYQLLAGSYGIGWVDNVFMYMLCSDNTQYQPDQQHLLLFGEFLTKGDAWMIIRNEWDWSVIGRSISRPYNVSVVDIDSDWVRLLARSIERNDTKTELMNFADRLDNEPNAPLLIGNKHFYTSDYQVHRRANWTMAIKMQSIRTQGSECTNGENRKDEHGGQGVLNLYTADKNDYNFIFPLLDWQAINGITVEHGISLEPCTESGFKAIKFPFVGGVSDGQYGLAMMDTASHNLTAKRSWHFYDDAVIALATNLTLRTSTTAWTTLASRLLPTGKISIGFFNSTIITLNDGNYSFPYVQDKTSNVQWIHLGESNIGYVLQLQQQYDSLGVQVGTVTGNYNSINIYNHPVTARIVTLYINHGLGPYLLDYNYMILPNVSLESMPALIKQYDEEQLFACISSNNLFHGTMWPRLKRAAFVLWDNITTIFSCKSPMFEVNIELSDAGAYIFSESVTDFTLTASHPMRVHGTVKITVDRVGNGEGCTVSLNSDATTTNVVLALPSSSQLLGASVNVTCKK
jgi:chondroitin AC lyase